MTVATPTTAAPPTGRPHHAPRPGLGFTTSVLVRGQLAWLGWVWASILVLLPIGLLVISGAGGDPSESVWAAAGIGWQRWMLFTAGLVTIRTFLRVLVSRGVTRRRVGDSATATMVTLAIGGAAVGMLGYLVEWLVFRSQGWTFALADGTTVSAGQLGRLAAEYALVGAIYFAAGWIVGASFVRYHWAQAILLIPVCFVPVVAVELALGREASNVSIGHHLDHPALAVTLVVALAAIGATVAVARRVTRSLPLR